MFRLIKVRDIVRVEPHRFGEPLEAVVEEKLREKYEGILDKDVGTVIMVTKVEGIGLGHLVPGDGATYHEVIFEALAYKPEDQEVVEGEVVDVAKFGAFVRIGPMDALVHVSQIMDDYVDFDEKGRAFIGRESGRRLTVGDIVRARVVAVSIDPERGSKIGLTMRQPHLGALSWIKEEKEREKKEVEKTKKGKS